MGEKNTHFVIEKEVRKILDVCGGERGGKWWMFGGGKVAERGVFAAGIGAGSRVERRRRRKREKVS